MATQKDPVSREQAPDPASSYERAKPEKEAGMGRLHSNPSATPTGRPDQVHGAVPNKQDPKRQINAEDVTDSRKNKPLAGSGENPEAAKETARIPNEGT